MFSRPDTVLAAEAAARMAVLRSEDGIPAEQLLHELPYSQRSVSTQPLRRSLWGRFFGHGIKRQPAAHADVAKSLEVWRGLRQPVCVRLERSLAQARAVLSQTQAKLAAVAAAPAMSLRTASPVPSPLLDGARDISGSNGLVTAIAMLQRQEQALASLCDQIKHRLDVARSAANALNEKINRTRSLHHCLSRCRCVYQVTSSAP